jgi:hypothetical protein
MIADPTCRSQSLQSWRRTGCLARTTRLNLQQAVQTIRGLFWTVMTPTNPGADWPALISVYGKCLKRHHSRRYGV